MLAIWLVCACSLLAVRYLSHRRPNTPGFATEAKGIYEDLESLSKQKIALYESAILKLGDDSVHLVPSFGVPTNVGEIFRPMIVGKTTAIYIAGFRAQTSADHAAGLTPFMKYAKVLLSKSDIRLRTCAG